MSYTCDAVYRRDTFLNVNLSELVDVNSGSGMLPPQYDWINELFLAL